MQPAVAMITNPVPHPNTPAAARRLAFVDEPGSAMAWIAECRRLLATGITAIGLRSDDADGNRLADAIADGLGAGVTRRLTAATGGPAAVDRDVGAIAILGSDPDAVSAALLDYVDAGSLTLLAPRTARYWSKLPLYLISIPKAGTHLLFQLAEALGYKPGGQTPHNPTGGNWYYLLNTNAHTGADEFFLDALQRAPFGNRAHPFMRSPALFNYRHPLDILVSEASYFHLDGKSPLSVMLSTLSFEERIDRLIDDPWLLGTLRHRVGRFAAWLDCANVIPVSFEEMVGSPGGGSDADLERLIWSLQLKLHVPGNPAAVREIVQRRDSATFREGRIGGWRDKLPAAALAKVRALPQDFMARFGYGIDVSPTGVLPKSVERFRHRPLTLSRADFRSTPILVRPGVLGHNIVAFRDSYLAVPMATGPLDLTAFSPSDLSSYTQGTTVDDVVAELISRHVLERQSPRIDTLKDDIRDLLDRQGRRVLEGTEKVLADSETEKHARLEVGTRQAIEEVFDSRQRDLLDEMKRILAASKAEQMAELRTEMAALLAAQRQSPRLPAPLRRAWQWLRWAYWDGARI